ncbi:MAG: cytochrome c-type biogenesis protein [Rhizomicrobium sp.]|jgi:cytochrome c-type biogenesis protein CcmH
MMRAVLLAALMVLFAQTALAQSRPDSLADPRLEARAVELQRELRCLVCQGQSLDESTAPLAADLRRFIRIRIAGGETDERIKQELVARYGDVILMEPPFDPQTYLLWFGPFLVLILCGSVAGVVVVRARKNSRQQD